MHRRRACEHAECSDIVSRYGVPRAADYFRLRQLGPRTMARRKSKRRLDPKPFIGIVTALIGIIVIGGLLQSVASGIGTAVGPIILLIAAAAVAYPVIRGILIANTRRSLFEKARSTTDKNIASLVRRRAQLVQSDAYGKPQTEKWVKEIDLFIERHFRPLLTPAERKALARHYNEVTRDIESRVEDSYRTQPVFQTFSNKMMPTEFERFCADQLQMAGWDARVTSATRDQGIDVLAEKAGYRIVIQCKLYSRPVGNKAVQEVTAAKGHERANFGIVVSNNRYTAAAEQLAATNGVFLLHYSDLSKLDEILGLGRSAGDSVYALGDTQA